MPLIRREMALQLTNKDDEESKALPFSLSSVLKKEVVTTFLDTAKKPWYRHTTVF